MIALTVALEELLVSPIEVLEKMADRAHKRVVERHSVDIEAKKLAELFHSVSA